MTMVVMAQMTQFMKKDVIPQHLRKAHYIQIQIDIASGRAASPVGEVVLDGDFAIRESLSPGQFLQSYGQHFLCRLSQSLYFPI